MSLFRKDTTSSSIDDPTDAGTGVPTEDVDVVPVPSDPRERQAYIQSLVAEVVEEHSGEDLDTTFAALSSRLERSGLPPQPEKWIRDTASEITEGRHVVVDRNLAVSSGPGADELPAEARDSDA